MEGDCHFVEGNLFAKRRVSRVKGILDRVGVGGERLEMFNLSAGMGGRFAEVVEEMTQRVRALGPNPVKPRKDAAARPTEEVATR
jgi:coenzyme F420-reducing hydrogenase delta subunit